MKPLPLLLLAAVLAGAPASARETARDAAQAVQDRLDAPARGASEPALVLHLSPPAAPAPSGGVSGAYTATATWCAPTPTRCTDWGGEALLAAVHSFTDGDDPYLVTVSRGKRSVVVTVVSFCACRGTDRAIDLSPYAFRQLAPLSRGRIDVVVTDYQLPRTDADLRMMLEVRGDELYR